MHALRDTVLIGQVQEAFGKDGTPGSPAQNAALKVMLDDLAWWGELLKLSEVHNLSRTGGLVTRDGPFGLA